MVQYQYTEAKWLQMKMRALTMMMMATDEDERDERKGQSERLHIQSRRRELAF